MKTSNTTTGLLAALLMASPLASAESQYPAANFEPVIISRDADLIAKHGQAAKDRAVAEQAKLAKRNQAVVTPVATDQAPEATRAAADIESPKSDNNPSNQKESSMENFPIALVVFALAGFVFWSTKRPGAKVQEVRYDTAVVSTGSAGETGVAKYLNELEASARKAAGTGVTRYLKSLEVTTIKAAETGVAKYIKNADLSSKKAAETGVERYLNSRGR